MKKASYILLAMMLIIAVFVSCKAEVIDDSDFLVNVMFSSENNSKGLTWSRDFVPDNYYWSYDASKADNGPRTGTATKAKVGGDEGKGGLLHDVGPFSVGTWDFTLYGYTNAERTELVYEGHTQAFLAKGSSNPVKVNVSSKDEQAGTILVSKDIRLTDGTNATYAPTHFSIKNAKDSSFAEDTSNNSLQDLDFNTTEDMSYTVRSGSYVVTIEMKEGSTVYSSSQIYINVYDYQTTVVGGSLDDVKVSTRFEASDGTIVGTSNETAINVEGPTILTTPEGVTPVKSGTTAVGFPQDALGTAENATLKVIASPTPVSSKFCIEGESSPLAGIDLSVFVDGKAVTNFASPVTVTTYVAKDLTSKKINDASEAESEGLKVVYNGSGDQPTITSYDPTTGMLVFTTSHFSQYYVTSSRIVAVNVDANVAYTSLKDAVDAVTDSGYITLLQDVTDGDGILIPAGNRSITVDLNDKTYTITKGFTTDKSFGPKKVRECGFSLGKGNSVVLKNGTIKPGKTDKVLIQNYCNLVLNDVNLDCSKKRSTSVLSCSYGTTQVVGKTNIFNMYSNYNNTSVVIHNLFLDNYKEGVSVEFGTSEERFCGKVNSCILFELDNEHDYDGTKYMHSLIIKNAENDCFSNAEFDFPQVGARSVFEMNGNPTIYLNGKAQYPVKYDQNSNTATLSSDDFLVLNKKSDVRYEELGRAVNNSTDGQVLVLQKDITMQSAIANPFITKSITIDLNGKTLGVNDSVSTAIITLESGCLTIEDGIGGGKLSKSIDSFFGFNGGKLVIKGGTFNSDPKAYVNTATHNISKNESAVTWTVTVKN